MQARMGEEEIPEDRVLFDPIVLPITSQQDQVQGCTQFMMMVKDLFPDCRTNCGVSNVSNGAPEELRPILNLTYLVMLMKYGMDAAIVNAYETELVDTMRGKRPELVDLIYRVMDGEEIDMAALDAKEVDYVKTTQVLLGESLYSHSWLQL
jgi:5-methyltetrahydrofolate corrinoid/iron sulfur protein methyltransferase